MKKNKIKIGILGCANIADRSIIPSILELNDCFQLVAIASRSEEKAIEFATKFHCEAITGYQNMIDRNDIDALYIPLPTGLHKEWVTKALESGKHIYVEKSFAFNYADAAFMVNLAKTKNLALMEGYMFIYHSQHEFVKQIIAKGEIGEIRSFRSSFGFPPLDENNFRYDKNIGGGVVFDAAGYPLRATHLILGNDLVVTSSSLYLSKKTNTALYGSAFLKNSSGKSSQISFGFDNYYQCSYEVWGSKGKITVKKAFTPRSNEEPEIIIENQNGIKIINAPSDNHFKKAFIKFSELIQHEYKELAYNDILIQSQSLDSIIDFSNK
jgi:dTDP-3,4-didehydro-2,6-dideoxy-alpha-D-glucose 3-reductase